MDRVSLYFIFSLFMVFPIAYLMTIGLAIPLLSVCLGIYLIKKIYFDENLFGYKITISPNNQLIVSVVIFMISIVIAGASYGSYVIEQNEKKIKLNEAANIVYEEIKESYSKEDYDSVKEKLDNMKKQYGSTASYTKAFSDFGDFDKKKKEKEVKKKNAEKKAHEEWVKKADAEWEAHAQEFVDGYTTLLRGIPGVKEVFDNVSSNGYRVTVFVNNNWYILSNDAKKGFIQRAVVLWGGRLKGFSLMPSWHSFDLNQDFRFVHTDSGRTVATWKKSWGPSIKE